MKEFIKEEEFLIDRQTDRQTGYPSIDKTHLKGVSYLERNPFIPGISIVNAMKLLWKFCPNDAAVCYRELHASHRMLLDDGRIVAKAFRQLGIDKGDIICVCAPNCYQGIVSFIAGNKIGAIVTFLNPFAPIEELVVQLNRYESPLLIYYDVTNEKVKCIKERTAVKNIISLDAEAMCSRAFYDKSDSIREQIDVIDYRQLKQIGDQFKGNPERKTKGKDSALILFTSGSTGEPKDMLFTNEAVLAAGIYYKNSGHLHMYKNDNRRWMSVVPFMYPYGFAASVLSTLLAGREVLLAPDLCADNLNYYLAQNPGLIFGSPACLELIKRNINPDIKIPELHTFISGGDFLSEQASRDAIKMFERHGARVEIANGSGNGELLGCCTNSMNVEYRPDTVGKLVNGPDFAVLNDETGEEVKYGENGILCVSGKQLFKEYYKNPKLTDKAMVWFNGKRYYRTGNYGHLSEDGYFTLVGRESRFFIINTLNKVYCELVQKIVSSIDVVEECAIVPKPNKTQLFESKAYVVLKPGIERTQKTKDYIMNKAHTPYTDSYGNVVSLKDYEVPYSVTFVDELARTVADKVDYETMRKEAEKEYLLENA